jgi:E3 ubiquitin-protein ligase DOA10
MFNSIIDLPNEIMRFWNAGAGIKIQVLFLLFLLYLLGYYSSKLMQNRNWWKWLILIFLAGPFLIQIYFSKQVIVVFPVLLGIFKGLVLGKAGFNPLGAFEGIADFILSVRYRRGHAEIHQKYEEAEEILHRAKEYENQSRKQYHEQSDSKEQFREEMKRQRAEQEQEAKQESKQQSSQEQAQAHSENVKPRASESETNSRTPREILGLGSEFTQVDLKKARNEALKRCHSDKWADKPKAMQKVMEEETKKINWAYEKLCK